MERARIFQIVVNSTDKLESWTIYWMWNGRNFLLLDTSRNIFEIKWL